MRAIKISLENTYLAGHEGGDSNVFLGQEAERSEAFGDSLVPSVIFHKAIRLGENLVIVFFPNTKGHEKM